MNKKPRKPKVAIFVVKITNSTLVAVSSICNSWNSMFLTQQSDPSTITEINKEPQ